MWSKLPVATTLVPSLERATVTVSDQAMVLVLPMPLLLTVHVTTSGDPEDAVAGTVTSWTTRSAYGIGIRSSCAVADAALFDSEPFSNTTPAASVMTKTVNRPDVPGGANIVSVRL